MAFNFELYILLSHFIAVFIVLSRQDCIESNLNLIKIQLNMLKMQR